MLAKDPRRRYSSPLELVHDLLLVVRAAGLRPAAPGGRTWTVPTEPSVPAYYRHLPWIVSLLALVVIVVVLDFLWAYMPGPAEPPPLPAAAESDNNTVGLMPATSPASSATSAASDAAKPSVPPRAQADVPVLPSSALPNRPFSSAHGTVSVPEPLPAVPRPEKSSISAAKQPDLDSREGSKDSGKIKPAPKSGDGADGANEPAGRWISGATSFRRGTGSL
jgi:hypothetical protein